MFNHYSAFDQPKPFRPWDRIDEAQRYLLQVAQGKLPPDLLRELDDDTLKKMSLSLAHVLRLLQDDFKATSAIRRAFADEHRTDTQLEKYLTNLAVSLIDEPEEAKQ